MDNIQLYWIRNENSVWEKVNLIDSNNEHMIFKDENDEIIKISKKEKKKYLLRNSDEEDNCNNLTNLVNLNAASILNNLNLRYDNNNIYTFNDNILLAINPFKTLDIYDKNIIDIYNSNSNNIEQKLPHPYLVGQLSYDNLKNNNVKMNQSILVSGESGAGKTQTTKYIMNYLSSITNSNTSIEKKILAANPILEAFGNAKTLRNDNSSRFGKFIKLLFDENYNLVGGLIDNYLLEKIRVTSLCSDERNFHIFYILLKSLNDSNKKDLYLQNIDTYNYLNKSLKIDRDDGVDDNDLYLELLNSFNTLEFNKNEIDDIFKVISFILNLGNIKNNHEINDNKYLNNCCNLINIDKIKLIDILKNRYLTINNETIQIENNNDELCIIRDTISQILYNLLFNFIVKKINNTIYNEFKYYIGILDIFGFEVFENNGFEQLAINYTNEKLQNIFNKYIFELEQIEYSKENIEWKNIDYPNNNEIVDLIENKQGIYGLLMEQCILKSGTDNLFYNNLLNINNSSINIENSDIVKQKINIGHYAGKVSYTINNFIEKNKNICDKRIYELFNTSNSIIKQFNFSSHTNILNNKNNFVINQFKIQLNKLLTEINSTKQHYIRCIKPNDENLSNLFNRKRVYEQLKYCGVLEAVKVARAGYPIRIKKNLFISEFYSVMNKLNIKLDIDNIYIFISKYYPESDKKKKLFQIGKTKIFMKREVYEEILNEKKKLLTFSTIQIQKNFKKYIYQKKYKNLRKIVINLQIKWRDCLLRKNSALKIQSIYKKYKFKKYQKKLRLASIRIKNKIYSFYLRNRYINLRYNTIKIQSYLRLTIQKNKFIKERNINNAVLKIEKQYILYKNREIILKNLKKILSLNKKNQLLELELEELKNKSKHDSIVIKKDFQIELENLRNENIQNESLLKEELEEIEIKNSILELELNNVNKQNEINQENIKNIRDKLDEQELVSKSIIDEKEKMIENLILENNNLKNNNKSNDYNKNKNELKMNDKSNINDIQANYELAQKMEDLYLKLSIAEEQLKQTNLLKYNKNKGFFDYLRDIFG